MEASCLKCIFILIGGLALFPNEVLTISAYHAELMCLSIRNPEKSLSQSVLAFTIRDLSSACLGGSFFGSPFLVLRWLDEHILLPALDAGHPLEEYVRRFCVCEVKPQIDFFNPLSTFWTAYDPKYFLTLVGATEFVRYNPQRCFSMLGIPRTIPPMPHFSNMILSHLRDTPGDLAQVYFHSGIWEGKGRSHVLSSWDNPNVNREAISNATHDVWYEGVKPNLFIEFPAKKQKL